MSILLSELAKSAIPNQQSSSVVAEETVNAKVVKKDYIYKLALIMQKWISETPLVNKQSKYPDA